MTQVVEDILRPLAEATVPCPECQGGGVRIVVWWSSYVNFPTFMASIPCPPRIPDPRFEALRWPPPMGYWQPPAAYWGGVNASLGAIIDSAQACGLWFIVLTRARCLMAQSEWDLGWEGIGPTPIEAAARALVAVWRGE